MSMKIRQKGSKRGSSMAEIRSFLGIPEPEEKKEEKAEKPAQEKTEKSEEEKAAEK